MPKLEVQHIIAVFCEQAAGGGGIRYAKLRGSSSVGDGESGCRGEPAKRGRIPRAKRQDAVAVLRAQLGWGALRNNPTLVNDAHEVGLLGLLHVVRRQEDRDAVPLTEVADG